MRPTDIQKLAVQSIFSAYGLDKVALDSASPLGRAAAGALAGFIPGAIAGGGLAYLTADPEEQAMKSRVAKGALVGGGAAAAANALRHGVGRALELSAARKGIQDDYGAQVKNIWTAAKQQVGDVRADPYLSFIDRHAQEFDINRRADLNHEAAHAAAAQKLRDVSANNPYKRTLLERLGLAAKNFPSERG